MSRIYIPTTSADQWAAILAEPTKHWRTGFSARTLAHSWQEAQDFPAEVKDALATSNALRESELLLAIPEHQVSLPGGGRPSQNDVWALARSNGQLVSIAVEGKVAEPFGPTLGEWLEQPSAGKSQRLAFLQSELGLSSQPDPGIRYQLLHRTVSAVLEAKRFGAPHAVMLVHSFSQEHQWFGDFAAFAGILGVGAEVGRVFAAGERGGVHLHLGWVRGNPAYLEK
jgi:hypothetical protein